MVFNNAFKARAGQQQLYSTLHHDSVHTVKPAQQSLTTWSTNRITASAISLLVVASDIALFAFGHLASQFELFFGMLAAVQLQGVVEVETTL